MTGFSPTISAQEYPPWTNLGIYGGHVYDIAVDPERPGRILAATHMGKGLFLSEDSGASWRALEMEHLAEGEDTFNEHAVYAVAIAPSNPDIIYVGHNYWLAKSIDGGRTWTHIKNGTMQQECPNCDGYNDGFRTCRAIAIHPTDPDRVYVGTGDAWSSNTGGAVYATGDGGNTWNKINSGTELDYVVEDLAIDPDNPDIIWAVTHADDADSVADGSVYRSEDGGQRFVALQPKPKTGGIRAVALKPDDADTVFLATEEGIVQLTRNEGQWSAVYPVADSRAAADVAFPNSDPDMVYAAWMHADDSALQGNGLPKISRGTLAEGVWSWETVTLDPQDATALQCLAVHPTDADLVFGGDRSLGMLVSRDRGQLWTPINQGLDAVIVYDVATDKSDITHMLAASGSGLFERVDADAKWIKRHNGDFRSVTFQPSTGNRYFGGSRGFVARTNDSGTDWAYSNDLGDAYVTDIAADPLDSDRVYITTGQSESGRQVLRSIDGGATFAAVLDGVNQDGQSYAMNQVLIDPHDHRHLLAGGGNLNRPRVLGDLWESSDGGDTWTRTGLTNRIVNAVLMDPSDPMLIYAGCGYSYNYSPPLLKSTDGGATWEQLIDGLPNKRMMMYDLWAASPRHAMAVGWDGMVVFYDGHSTTLVDSGAGAFVDLYGIFGLSPNEVWVVGVNGVIRHYDGSQWAPMESGIEDNLNGVWAAAVDQVMAVGDNGRILTYDGSAWRPMQSGTTENLQEIFGFSAAEAYAVGANGTILQYDGQAWEPMSSPTQVELASIWGTDSANLFASGDGDTVLHYDGAVWSTVYAGGDGTYLGHIWGSSADNVYVAAGGFGRLLHFDGNAWTQSAIPGANETWGVWGSGSDTLFVSDTYSGLYRHDGAQWRTLREPGTIYRSVTDLALHPTATRVVYAATLKAGVFVSPNQAGNWLNLGTPANSVFAIDTGSLYAATGGGMYQLTGTGVVAGSVYNAHSLVMIDGAQVTTDLGLSCRSVDGNYMMVAPAGIFDLYATADQHGMVMAEDVAVVGADVTWQDFEMPLGSSGDGTSSGAVTIDNDSDGGGAYCFVATVDPDSCSLWPLKPFLWIAAIFALVWPMIRQWPAFLLMAACISMVGLVSSASAFTIFQQVGVSSPPLPVGSGARAMGMGGAFIAIADDATAASWNPAGLVQLERPEISIVGDYYWRTESYTSEPYPEVDNTSHNDHGNLNYLSAAFPFQWHKNMVVSVNYQRLYDFYRELNYRRNLSEGELQLNRQIQYDQSGTVGAVGLAGAVELTPRLSLGLTVNIWTDQLGYDNGWEANYNETATGSQAGVPVTVNTSIQDRYEQFRGVNFNLGLLWDMERWGVMGLVAKTPFTATIQHHFSFEQTQTFGAPVNSTSTNGPIRVDEEVDLHLPWSYGLGWSKRFGDRFSVDIDLYRTEWSDYYIQDSQGEEFSPIDGRPRSASDVDATTHLRVGGEYLLLWPDRKLAVPIRTGLFYDPQPSEGQPEDVYGIALGSGVSMPRCSIDLAYQLRWAKDIDTGNIIATSSADITQHTLLVSLIYYF